MLVRSGFCLFLLIVFTTPAHTQSRAAASQKLLAASLEGDHDGIVAALRQGADPNAIDDDGDPPLTLIAYPSLFGKEQAIVKALTAAGARVDLRNNSGATPLMRAAAQGRDSLVRVLLEAGADPNALDSDGWSPLMYASYNRESFSARSLIDAGAKVDVRDERGWTPLLLALSEGAGSLAEALIEKGAAVPTDGPLGLSPLMHAIYSRDLQSVRVVLATKPDLETLDADGWTGLEVAAYNGDGQIVMDLLRAGANASFKDPEGLTARDRAANREYHEVAALLGGKWKPEAPDAGETVKVPCTALGGDVLVNIRTDGEMLVATAIYPRPVTWYLGGGLSNRARSSRKLTFEGTIAPEFHFDIDADPRTGRGRDAVTPEAAGTEYALVGSEYGTSTNVPVMGPNDQIVQRSVYTLATDMSLEKMGSPFSSENGEPVIANVNGVLVTSMPLSSLELATGKKTRVVTRIGTCKPVVSTITLR